jgi:FtsZ-binding cell division protein ZapB
MNQLELSNLRVQATQLYENIQEARQSIKSVNDVFHQQVANLQQKQSVYEEQFQKLMRQINEVEGKIALDQIRVNSLT